MFCFYLKVFQLCPQQSLFITEAWGDFSSNLQKKIIKKKSVKQNLTAHVSYKTVFWKTLHV